MLKHFLLLIFFLSAVCGFSQDAKRSKFSAGLSIGYKTPNGLGLILSYHPHPVLQVDLLAGYTRYNGAKFAGGFRIYPYNKGKVKPFISHYYSISTGAEVKAGNVPQQKERYSTYSNQYIFHGLGITILGEETGHSLQVGYSLGLNNPDVKSYDLGNGYYASRDKVMNSLKSGIMATYNLFIFFNKPRKR